MGALGVEGEDPVAVADDDEVVDPGLQLRRAALGDVGQAAEVERDPLRAGAAPGVAVDVGPDEVHEVAADRRAEREQEVADDEQRRSARSDRSGCRSGSRARSRRATSATTISVRVDRRPHCGRCRRPRCSRRGRSTAAATIARTPRSSATSAPTRLADDVGDDRDGQRADRDVGHAAWTGWPSHVPLRKSLIGRIGRNRRRQPAVVEVAERLRPSPPGRRRAGSGSDRSSCAPPRPSLRPPTAPDRGFAYARYAMSSPLVARGPARADAEARDRSTSPRARRLAGHRRRLLDHLDGRGARRQPGLRVPAAVPPRDGRARGRSAPVRRAVLGR